MFFFRIENLYFERIIIHGLWVNHLLFESIIDVVSIGSYFYA